MSITITPNLPFNDYLKLPAINISTLCEGFETMAHLKASLDGKIIRDTAALGMGRAIHARLLEPQVYRDTYVVSKPCSARLKSGKREGCVCGNTSKAWHSGQWYCGVHEPFGATVPNFVSENEAERIEQIYQAVLNHDVVKLIRLQGGYETTLEFAKDGIACKARLDKLVLADDQKFPPVVIDIKKVRRGHAEPSKFEKAVNEWHYDAKAAWYVDAVSACCLRDPAEVKFVWVVVEDDVPFSVRVIQCDEDTIAIGRFKYQDLFVRYRKCVETGEWPGYSNKVEFGGLPEWERKRWNHLLHH